MEFHVEGSTKTKRFVESLLPSMLEQLKLTKSKKLLHVIIDPDLEDLGTTVPLKGMDTYLVVLRPVKDIAVLGATLAHELTHVAQFAKGTLRAGLLSCDCCKKTTLDLLKKQAKKCCFFTTTKRLTKISRFAIILV